MQYNLFTVNVVNNSPIVYGNSTAFSTNVEIGDAFKIVGDPALYTVASIQSDTQLTLSTNYQGATVNASAYAIVRDFTPYLALAEVSVGDQDWATILTQKTIRKLDSLLGGLNLSNTNLQGRTWKDLKPLAVYQPGGGFAPNITAIGGAGSIKAQQFPNENVTEEYNPAYQFDHDWIEGSTVVPHLHMYVPANGASPLVLKFKMVYIWDNVDALGADGVTPDTEHTVYGTYNVPANAPVNPNAIVSFGNIAGTGKKISSIMSCRIARESNANGDTYNNAVWLRSADVHVECTLTGSVNQYTK